MRHIIIKAAIVVSLAVSGVFAQREGNDTPAPVPAPRPPAKSAKGATSKPVLKKYVCKPGAPRPIQEWVAKWPYFRAALLDQKQKEIDQAKADAERIRTGSVQYNTVSRGTHRERAVDRASEAEWKRSLDAARGKVGTLIREKKIMEADTEPKVYPLPAIEQMRVGAVGSLGSVRIFQIIDDDDMLVETRGKTIWLKGFSTEGKVDDQLVMDERGATITGTTKYDTLFGTRTVFVAAPCAMDEWIELEEVKPLAP